MVELLPLYSAHLRLLEYELLAEIKASGKLLAEFAASDSRKKSVYFPGFYRNWSQERAVITERFKKVPEEMVWVRGVKRVVGRRL